MAQAKYKKWLEKDNLLKLEAWARNGLTDVQIAHNMGINVSTLYTWKNNYEEINEALKRGKEVVDILVENALLKRALGYEYEEVEYTEKVINGKVSVSERHTTKQVVPDVTAQIYWLKNRKPTEWRDRPRLEDSETIDKLDEVLSEIKSAF